MPLRLRRLGLRALLELGAKAATIALPGIVGTGLVVCAFCCAFELGARRGERARVASPNNFGM